MNRPEKGIHIAKNIKVVDWLKTEILDQIASLFRGLHYANQQMIIDSLSSILVSVYVLARRMGIPYREVDQVVTQKLREHMKEGHQLEEWYGDLSAMEKYINKR
ncbi:MazG-like family protein [Thermoactinomyces sp. DSM 45891]|uniref:MazG-like nucleotide pyrophosphohydrolase family protein n=1 Tax=Baia soyae TaxID=1544746 RepID=A0A4V2SYG9_9BACL|nr:MULTISPECIES: MazG-like family protein [Thermoactinomycetaceae]TCP70263.1 MazG-like nucleotide pyrophosphohydrolase family protein [Baia soyae]SFX30761.1 MazG-like family protein [Thermoactinomyces sp. DSM 45891]